MRIDNFELDGANREFEFAVDLVRSGEKLIYLTGKAGSGKTTFLKYIIRTSDKKTVVLAPTGVAALNAGGQTIHSFFKIAPSVYVPGDHRLRTEAEPWEDDQSSIFDNFKYKKKHKNLLQSMELLIIDEVSMVRCDLLDVVDRLLRVFRDCMNKPFGGVQVVLIGDAFQLPPIAQNEHWSLLQNYYETPFFFSSQVLKENKPRYIELKKIYRQHDINFINLLNNIRVNRVSQEDLDLLNSRFIPAILKNENTTHVTIATHNRIVDDINHRKLEALDSELKVYEAEITGEFPDSMMPTDRVLNLKAGAQVMFIKNDPEKKYYNGKIARIKKLLDNKIIIEMPDGEDIEVKKDTWSNISYSWNNQENKVEEKVTGEFKQFPIRLAWAVTVHKCQGLTFEKVIADLSGSFSAGQVYVALSRCTSIEGLVLKSRISRNVIKADPHVVAFTDEEEILGDW